MCLTPNQHCPMMVVLIRSKPFEDTMPNYHMVIKCNMRVQLTVEAENIEKVREWFDRKPEQLYTLIESPSQEASDIELEKIEEFNWIYPEYSIE